MTNTKQIAVYKNRKALIEFMDDTRYEKKPMAWPHSHMSRIRINAKYYGHIFSRNKGCRNSHSFDRTAGGAIATQLTIWANHSFDGTAAQ